MEVASAARRIRSRGIPIRVLEEFTSSASSMSLWRANQPVVLEPQ